MKIVRKIKQYISKKILKRKAIDFFKSGYKKKVLICYVLKPFVSNKKKLYRVHNNRRQAMNIAEIFHELGFRVDVISNDDPGIVNDLKDSEYDVFFGRGSSLTAAIKRYHSALCIYHATGMPGKMSNRNENKRINEVNKQWGSTFNQARPMNEEDENYKNFDAIVALGNNNQKVNYSKVFNKKIELIENVTYDYSFPKPKKDWENIRKNFFFSASKGKILGGMDLLFPIFDKHRDWNLHIITEFFGEEDFFEFFKDYLTNKPNIFFYGRHEVNSKKFNEVVNKCCATIVPVCAAGQNGVAISAMSYGLFPIISDLCNIDLDGGGIIVKSLTSSAVEKAMNDYLKISDKEIEKICIKVQEKCLKRYSSERNKKQIKRALTNILKK